MKPQPAQYFSRMVTVPEVGSEGLERLQSAHVTIFGVGGVGSAAAFYLARTGVGHLRLIDQDIVEPSNLHRLHGADQSHLYHSKAEVAAETLPHYAPWTKTEPIIDTLRASNVNELLSGSDIVVDGLDNFRTRYLLNQYSHTANTPYVFASAVRNQGHLGVFHPPETGCLECEMPGVLDRPEESCESLGVTPTITGLVGGFAASEVTKILLQMQAGLMGRLLTIDTVGPDFVVAKVSKRKGCRICGGGPQPEVRETDPVTILCGGKAISVLPKLPSSLDLELVSRSVPDQDILAISSAVLVYRRGPVVVSLFRTGRMLIDGVEGREEALQIATQTWRQAGESLAHLA